MKKILTVLLIAVMAAGFVFASFSGKAVSKFGYNTEDGTYGFDLSDSEVNFDLDLGTSAATANEGDVYAEAEASVKVQFANGLSSKKAPFGELKKHFPITLADGSEMVGLKVETDWAAKIVGTNWSVALKSNKFGVCDLASSALDFYRDGKKSVFGDKYVGYDWAAFSLAGNWDNSRDRYGIEAKAFDFTLGLVLDGKEDEKDFKAYFLTKEFTLDGFGAQFGAQMTYAGEDATEVGVSAKLGYTGDKFNGSIATDVEFNKNEKKFVEVAANAEYDFVSFDGYYINSVDGDGYFAQYDKHGRTTSSDNIYLNNYLSAKLAFDFAKFDVPVTFSVTGKNLLSIFDGAEAGAAGYLKNGNKADFKFEVAYDGIVRANASFEINGEECYAFVLGAGYDAALFSVDATFTYDKLWLENARIMPTLVLSSDKLVSGAKLELGWYSNKDDYKFDESSIAEGCVDKGWIGAKCTIAF